LVRRRALRTERALGVGRIGVTLDVDDLSVLDVDELGTTDRAIWTHARERLGFLDPQRRRSRLHGTQIDPPGGDGGGGRGHAVSQEVASRQTHSDTPLRTQDWRVRSDSVPDSALDLGARQFIPCPAQQDDPVGTPARRFDLDDVPRVQRVETRLGVLVRDHERLFGTRELGTDVGFTPHAQSALGTLDLDDHEAGTLYVLGEALGHRLNLLDRSWADKDRKSVV